MNKYNLYSPLSHLAYLLLVLCMCPFLIHAEPQYVFQSENPIANFAWNENDTSRYEGHFRFPKQMLSVSSWKGQDLIPKNPDSHYAFRLVNTVCPKTPVLVTLMFLGYIHLLKELGAHLIKEEF